MPPTPEERACGPNIKLRAVNKSPIACYAVKEMDINLGKRTFSFNTLVGKVTQSVLGSNFLADAYLTANHRDTLLMDLNDSSTIAIGICHDEPPMRISFMEHSGPCWDLLDNFLVLSNPTFNLKQPVHGIQHHNPTMVAPV